MRRLRPEQVELGEIPLGDIRIDPRSRDDVPKIPRGIRSLVSNREFRTGLENPMEAGFLPDADGGLGRSGMLLRRILVFGVLEQGIDRDFNRLPHPANVNKFVRKFPGHADFIYERECIRHWWTTFAISVKRLFRDVAAFAAAQASPAFPSLDLREGHVTDLPRDMAFGFCALRKLLAAGMADLQDWIDDPIRILDLSKCRRRMAGVAAGLKFRFDAQARDALLRFPVGRRFRQSDGRRRLAAVVAARIRAAHEFPDP